MPPDAGRLNCACVWARGHHYRHPGQSPRRRHGRLHDQQKEVIEMLRQRSRPYLFSNSLPPPLWAHRSPFWISCPKLPNSVTNSKPMSSSSKPACAPQATSKTANPPLCPSCSTMPPFRNALQTPSYSAAFTSSASSSLSCQKAKPASASTQRHTARAHQPRHRGLHGGGAGAWE